MRLIQFIIYIIIITPFSVFATGSTSASAITSTDVASTISADGKYGFVSDLNTLEQKVTKQIIAKRSCTDYTLSCLLAKNNSSLLNLYFGALQQGVTASDFNNPIALPSSIQNYATDVSQVFAANNNADINSLDTLGMSPLHYAAALNNASMVGQLVTAGATMQQDKTLGLDPLVFAILLGFENSVQALTSATSKNSISTDNANYSYISLYSYFGTSSTSLAALIKLKGASFNINSQDSSKNSYLVYPIISGNSDIANYYINNGIDVNLANVFGMMSMHFAASYDRQDIVQLLSTKGANINLQDIYGMTPVFYAITNKNGPMFELLYNLGANLLVVNKIDQAALIYLIQYIPTEIDFLTKNNFNFSSFATKNGMTLLFYAYSVKLYNVVEKLFFDGLDVNSIDVNGNTILMLASYDNNTDLITFLITKKANLDLQAKSGDTALHYAVTPDNAGIVTQLVTAGAQTTIKNKLNFTAPQAAAMYLKKNSFLYFMNNLSTYKTDMKNKNYGSIANNLCKTVDYNYTETCQLYVAKLLN